MREDKGNNLVKAITDYTIIDLETTDKNPNRAKIIELSALKVRDDQVVDTFSQLVDPMKKIPKKIIELTGITDEMVAGQPTIDQVLGKYLDFIGDDIILGHNIASFDTTIICNYADILLDRKFGNDMVDTLRMAQYYCGLDLENYKLATVAGHYGVVNEHAHRALSDCYANLEVYKRLKKDLDKKKARRAPTKNTSYNRDYPDFGSFKPPFVYDAKTDTLIDTPQETQNDMLAQYLYTPDKPIGIEGKTIVLTGDFERGERSVLEAFLQSKGALIGSSVNKKTNILIIGKKSSTSYKYGSYGSKTAKAISMIDSGKEIKIILEDVFFERLGD